MRCEKAWEGKMRDHDLGSPSKYQDHQLEISCVYVCPFAKARLSSWDFVCMHVCMCVLLHNKIIKLRFCMCEWVYGFQF